MDLNVLKVYESLEFLVLLCVIFQFQVTLEQGNGFMHEKMKISKGIIKKEAEVLSSRP